MLVTFTCESYGQLKFFSDIARQLITLMGHSDTIPGAINGDDVEEALTNLLAGLSHLKDKIKSLQPSPDDEPGISLATRAVPLIDMLKSATKNNCAILWQ